MFDNRYPIFTVKLHKNRILYKTVDEIIEYFKKQIQKHPIADFLYVFDHYKHTLDIKSGQINRADKRSQEYKFLFWKET